MFDTYLFCSLTGQPIQAAQTIAPLFSTLQSTAQALDNALLLRDDNKGKQLSITRASIALLWHRGLITNPRHYTAEAGNSLIKRLASHRSLEYWKLAGRFILESKNSSNTNLPQWAWDSEGLGSFFRYLITSGAIPELLASKLEGQERLREELQEIEKEDPSDRQHLATTRRLLNEKMKRLDKRINMFRELDIHLYHRIAYLTKDSDEEIKYEVFRIKEATKAFKDENIDYPLCLSLYNYIEGNKRYSWHGLLGLVEGKLRELEKTWEDNGDLSMKEKHQQLMDDPDYRRINNRAIARRATKPKKAKSFSRMSKKEKASIIGSFLDEIGK